MANPKLPPAFDPFPIFNKINLETLLDNETLFVEDESLPSTHPRFATSAGQDPDIIDVMAEADGIGALEYMQAKEDVRFAVSEHLVPRQVALSTPLEFLKFYKHEVRELFLEIRQSSHWYFKVVEDKRDFPDVLPQSSSFGRSETFQLPISMNSRSQAEISSVSEVLLKMLSRSPRELHQYDKAMRNYMVKAAILNALSGSTSLIRLLPAKIISTGLETVPEPQPIVLEGSAQYFDVDTRAITTHVFRVEQDLYAPKHNVPELSPVFDIPTLRIAGETTEVKLIRGVIRQPLALMRFVQSRLQDQVFSAQHVQTFVQTLVAFARGEPAIAQGSGTMTVTQYPILFTTRREPTGCIILEPSIVVRNSLILGSEFEPIRALGPSYVREIEIRMLETLVSTGSMIDTWDSGVEFANAQWLTVTDEPHAHSPFIEETLSWLSAFWKSTKTNRPAARKQSKPKQNNPKPKDQTQLKKRKRPVGRPKGSKNKPKPSTDTPNQQPRQPQRKHPREFLAYKPTRKELRLIGFRDDELDDQLELVRKSVEQNMVKQTDKGRYHRDRYIDAERFESFERQPIEEGEGSPYDCQGDAPYPIGRLDGRSRIHWYIVPTARYANGYKGTFPPIWLKIAREFGHSTDPVKREELLQRVEHLYLVRQCLPHSIADRLALKLSDEVFAILESQFATGLAHADSPKLCWSPEGTYRIAYTGGQGPDQGHQDFVKRPEYLVSAEKIIREQEDVTGERLQRINNTSYPFRSGRIMRSWNGKMCTRFFSTRLLRLRTLCNRKFTTGIVHPVDLFLITCLQVLQPHPHSKDPFARYLSPIARHPTTISLGKDDHSRGMTTGLRENYSVLADYDPNACNILAQTWLFNASTVVFDKLLDEIAQDFEKLYPDNPPYWSLDLPTLTPIPDFKVYRKSRARQVVFDELSALQAAKDNEDALAEDDSDDGDSEDEYDEDDDEEDHGEEYPAHNMANLNACCYVVSAVQSMFHQPLLKDLFDDVEDNFPCDPQTNRLMPLDTAQRSTYMSSLTTLVSTITELFTSLSAPGIEKLARPFTEDLLMALAGLEPEFQDRVNDSNRVLEVVFNELDSAADRSENEPEMRKLLDAYMHQEEDSIRKGHRIERLPMDAEQRWEGHRASGHQSKFVDVLMSQFVRETQCPSESCLSPFSRTWEVSSALKLEIPPTAKRNQVFGVVELMLQWARGSVKARCGYDPSHPPRTVQTIRIVRPAPVIFLRIDRSFRSENDMKLNTIKLEETLDLSPWIHEHLPSEQDDPRENPLLDLKPLNAQYVLTGVVRYLPKKLHYITFSNVCDRGKMRWSKLDSLASGAPEWDASPLTEPGCEYVLTYTSSDKIRELEEAWEISIELDESSRPPSPGRSQGTGEEGDNAEKRKLQQDWARLKSQQKQLQDDRGKFERESGKSVEEIETLQAQSREEFDRLRAEIRQIKKERAATEKTVSQLRDAKSDLKTQRKSLVDSEAANALLQGEVKRIKEQMTSLSAELQEANQASNDPLRAEVERLTQQNNRLSGQVSKFKRDNDVLNAPLRADNRALVEQTNNLKKRLREVERENLKQKDALKELSRASGPSPGWQPGANNQQNQLDRTANDREREKLERWRNELQQQANELAVVKEQQRARHARQNEVQQQQASTSEHQDETDKRQKLVTDRQKRLDEELGQEATRLAQERATLAEQLPQGPVVVPELDQLRPLLAQLPQHLQDRFRLMETNFRAEEDRIRVERDRVELQQDRVKTVLSELLFTARLLTGTPEPGLPAAYPGPSGSQLPPSVPPLPPNGPHGHPGTAGTHKNGKSNGSRLKSPADLLRRGVALIRGRLPTTPPQPDDRGRQAPGTGESVHVGDRRRYGHIEPGTPNYTARVRSDEGTGWSTRLAPLVFSDNTLLEPSANRPTSHLEFSYEEERTTVTSSAARPSMSRLPSISREGERIETEQTASGQQVQMPQQAHVGQRPATPPAQQQGQVVQETLRSSFRLRFSQHGFLGEVIHETEESPQQQFFQTRPSPSSPTPQGGQGRGFTTQQPPVSFQMPSAPSRGRGWGWSGRGGQATVTPRPPAPPPAWGGGQAMVTPRTPAPPPGWGRGQTWGRGRAIPFHAPSAGQGRGQGNTSQLTGPRPTAPPSGQRWPWGGAQPSITPRTPGPPPQWGAGLHNTPQITAPPPVYSPHDGTTRPPAGRGHGFGGPPPQNDPFTDSAPR